MGIANKREECFSDQLILPQGYTEQHAKQSAIHWKQQNRTLVFYTRRTGLQFDFVATGTIQTTTLLC